VTELIFHKVEGLGNDFVLLDLMDGGALPTSEEVNFLCHRRFGVGADGVLCILPGGEEAAAQMHVINADGSVPQMCGNGLRCVAQYLHRHRSFGGAFSVLTGAGVLSTEICEPGVKVAMGKAYLECTEIPMKGKGRCLGEALEIDSGPVEIWAVSMGNPHAVIFDDPRPLEKLGPALQKHEAFVQSVNVSKATVRGNEIDLEVWERGVGPTQACGTAACATVVAACLKGLTPYDAPVQVHLPGGHLEIHVAADLQQVMMVGSAREVFSGRILLP
jgi:diaminopimelate epimerase